MPQSTFCRKEKKMLVDSTLVPLIQAAIAPHMEADRYNVDGRPYEIGNLYFDDDADSIIRHSLSKPIHKEKLRLRSYGTPGQDTNVFLEIKRKSNRIGTKRRLTMTLQEATAYIYEGTRPQHLSPLDRQILHEIDCYRSLHAVYPKVYIGYLRHAYHGRDDASFRLTIDHDIVTRRHDLALESGRYGTSLLPQGKTLVEIKFVGAVPLWFARVMSGLHLSFGSYSKYGNEYKHHLNDSLFIDHQMERMLRDGAHNTL